MDTMESTQNTKDQEIPGAFPYRLRDREQLRKRKLEAQEQKSSQEKSKTKRGRKGKASGTSNKLTKKPEPESYPAPEPVPCPEPVPLQEQKEEAKEKVALLSPQWEKPAPLQESPNLSITGDPATTSTDELGEIKLAYVTTPESLPLQAEDVPGGNAPFEEKIVLTM